jgi:hypothetical protein
MANQPQSAQQQQQAQKQVETALQSYAQAHGLFGGINWVRIAPLILQLFEELASGGASAQQQPGQQQTP